MSLDFSPWVADFAMEGFCNPSLTNSIDQVNSNMIKMYQA